MEARNESPLISIDEVLEIINEGLPPGKRYARQFVRNAIVNGSFLGAWSGGEHYHKVIIPRQAFYDWLTKFRYRGNENEKEN